MRRGQRQLQVHLRNGWDSAFVVFAQASQQQGIPMQVQKSFVLIDTKCVVCSGCGQCGMGSESLHSECRESRRHGQRICGRLGANLRPIGLKRPQSPCCSLLRYRKYRRVRIRWFLLAFVRGSSHVQMPLFRSGIKKRSIFSQGQGKSGCYN